MIQSKKKDQFYTKPDIAVICFSVLKETICLNKYDCFLEPSAGQGVFLDLFPIIKRVGIDIDPKRDDIIECDFFVCGHAVC